MDRSPRRVAKRKRDELRASGASHNTHPYWLVIATEALDGIDCRRFRGVAERAVLATVDLRI